MVFWQELQCLGYYADFNNINSNPWTQYLFSFIYVIFSLFHQCLIISEYRVQFFYFFFSHFFFFFFFFFFFVFSLRLCVFSFFGFFLGSYPRHMEVPSLEVKLSCSCQATPQPQQRRIWAESVTYIPQLAAMTDP